MRIIGEVLLISIVLVFIFLMAWKVSPWFGLLILGVRFDTKIWWKEVIKVAKVKKGSAAAKAKMAKVRAAGGKGKKKSSKGKKTPMM